MPLFQRPAMTPEEQAASRPLDISPDKVQEMTEEEWYEKVYRGDDVPQLTIRAVLMGSFLGFFLAFTNLYVGLMTGWALGVAITAAIMAYAIWNGLMAVGIARSPMTILETNCMQSTASSAGYATGGTMVSAISALLMLSATEDNPAGEHLPLGILILWTFFLGILGTVLAIPMKRNLINRERLRFPSGTAAAVTLQSLYSEGEAALRKARVMFTTMAAGAIFPLLIDLQIKKVTDPDTGEVSRSGLIPADTPIFDWFLPGTRHVVDGAPKEFKPSDWTLTLDHNPVMVAAGAIMGLRITIWMLVASLALAYVLGPIAYDNVWTSTVTGEPLRAATQPARAWKEIGIWFGVPIMVSYSLLAFAGQWRTILSALKGIGKVAPQDARTTATEVPMSWFAIGGSLSGAGVVGVAAMYFHVPVHFGVLAVALTFLLALVACRATGESDITPVGAMGKIMQLTYGVLIPQSMTANLMTASITSSSAGSAADLLNDLKSGYLLGANPRRQFIAQVSGVFTGTLATVLGFRLLVPDAQALMGDNPAFPAPSAQSWKAVAEVFKHGLDNMHPMHQEAIAYGLALGALLFALEKLPKIGAWLPSATGIGLGFILPFQYPFSMFLGAVIAALWTKGAPKSAEEYIVPAASGLIAGISIMGVIIAILNNLVLTS